MQNQSNSKSVWLTLGIIVIVLVVLFGAYLGLAAILRKVNNDSGTPSPTTTKTGIQSAGKFDANLAGTWISECLVPDADSPWSEKHQFVIKSDGSAVHTRWSSSGQDCSSNDTITNNYKLTIPASGQVNVLDTDQNQTFYDIYKISSNTLEFGHGFRGDDINMQVKDSNFGASPSTRITTLNGYIIYKKK